jgi:hypothetical protein
MSLEPNDVAKRVLIDYRQLSAIVKEDIGILTAATSCDSYNRILASLKRCFEIDESFGEAIAHFRSLNKDSTDNLSYQMVSDGRVLLATAHSFIEMYLSPEDKKKAIGFSAQD